MTALAQWTVYAFLACWAVGVAAWFHGTFYFMKWWLARAQGKDAPVVILRKTVPGLTIFLSAVALGFVFGLIGQYWGGGWR